MVPEDDRLQVEHAALGRERGLAPQPRLLHVKAHRRGKGLRGPGKGEEREKERERASWHRGRFGAGGEKTSEGWKEMR